RAAEGAGDPLRHHRRRTRASLEWHRHRWSQGRVAVVDTDRRRTGAAWPLPSLRAWRPAKSDGRTRPVSILRWQGHAVPYPRHQPARIYRPSHLLGLHPYDQRGRDRPLQSRQDRRDCRCPRANFLVIRWNDKLALGCSRHRGIKPLLIIVIGRTVATSNEKLARILVPHSSSKRTCPTCLICCTRGVSHSITN